MRAVGGAAEVILTPGSASVFVVEVTNELQVIDGITASLDAGEGLTATVEPPLLPLFPDGTGVLTLTLRPSPTFPAGTHRMIVELRSSVESATTSIVEFTGRVVPVPNAALTVLPPVRAAKRRARYGVVLDNTGNVPLDAALAASDPDRTLTPRFDPPGLLVAPGGSATATLTVTGRRRLLGSDLSRQVTVLGTANELELATSATFRHRPLIPNGARTIVVLGLIVAVWAAIFLVALNHAFSKDALTKDVPPSFYASTAAAHTASGATALGSLGTFRFQTAASDAAPAGAVPKTGVAIGVGGTISGTLTAASTQAGVGRITVEAVRTTPTGPTLVASAATGDDGTYNLVGLLPGDYYLHFTAQGFQDQWYPAAPTQATSTPVTVDAMGQTPGINAVVTGLPATISGTVATGTPVPAPVTVTVLPEQGATTTPVATVTTDSSGHYTIANLPAPGVYDLSFASPGYRVGSDSEQVGGGEQHTANTIDLSAANGSISGTVTDGANPLGGVTITAAANGQTFTSATPTTGTVGQFSLANLPSPATYLLTFTKTGFGTKTIAQALAPGQSLTNLAVAMAGGAGQVSGLVTSPTGAPLGGVSVTVNGAATPLTTQTLTAGQVGSYQVSGLATPGAYTLTFSLAGYSSQTVGVNLGSGGSASAINVVLPVFAGSLTGTVTAAGGGPLAGAAVAVTDGVTIQTTVTTSSPPGGFSVAGLTPGSYSVTVSLTGYISQTALVQVQPGQAASLLITLVKAA